MTYMKFGDFVNKRIKDFIEQNHKTTKGTFEYDGIKIPVVVEYGYDPTKKSLPWYIEANIILPGKPFQVIPAKMCYSSQEKFEEELKEYLKKIEEIN